MYRKASFEQLFRLHYTSLFCFARQMVSDEEECHDIVNDAYEELWRKFESIESTTAKAYLYASVRNRCINYLRHENVHRQYIDYCEKMTDRYTRPDDLQEQQERNRLIAHAIGSLKPPASEILRASYMEGKKYREIAEEMGLSLSYVKKQMVKAVAQIKELVNKNREQV